MNDLDSTTLASPPRRATRGKGAAHLFDDERAGKIYRTAAAMIYEKGFDATSMSGIAEAVDLTKPGLYYYVKGKKELLFAIMNFAMDRLDEEVVGPASQLDDPGERVRLIVREHARLLVREAGALAILIDEVRGLSPEQREAITARKRAYFDLLRSSLDEMNEQGRLRVESTTAAFSLLGMVMWLSRWYEPDGPLDEETVVANVVELAVGGVFAPGEATE